MLTICIRGSTVRITIWDDQALNFRKSYLLTGRESVVLVCTCMNPKLFAGIHIINNFTYCYRVF